jgi:hypothetical protein
MSAMSPFREDVEVAPAQGEGWSVAEAASATPFAAPEARDEWQGAEWEVPDVFEVAEGEEEGEAAHPILSLFPLLSKPVLDALAGSLWPRALALAAAAGYTDVNQLTNVVFYFRHPEVIGRKIRPEERELARDWIAIRDGIVKPALQAPTGGGPAFPAPVPSAPAPAPAGGRIPGGSLTSPPIPASRLDWPKATAEELAFMRAVYERHFKNSNVPGNSFVWDLPKDTLERIEPGDDHVARKDAAQKAGELLRAARAELGPGARIGVVSSYRPATLQFIIWQGKGRKGGFPAYYRIAHKKGIITPGDFGPDAVAKMARYLGGYIAFPGFSNHQDGLAIDFGEAGAGGWGAVSSGSPFHRWLQKNATARFGFHPLSTEAWHWTYRGLPAGAGAHEAVAEAWPAGEVLPAGEAGPGGGVRAGAHEVARVPLLASHAGRPPDLVLRWNDMPSAPAEIDVAVHLHGYWKPGLTLPANIVGVSGLDLAPVDGAPGTGRSRPTLTVLPRAHDTGVRQKFRQADGTYKDGPYNVYTFPALVTRSGLPDLVAFALERFAAQAGVAAPRLGRLILTAHSGGGLALLQILRSHDPHQVHVFDALYWPADALAAWARRHIGQDRAAIKGLDAAAARAYMTARGGALRVFYQGRYAGGTRPQSLAVLRSISAELGPEVRDWYRVEASDYDHFQIPRQYGWRVLADASADVPKAHQETGQRGARREAEALVEPEAYGEAQGHAEPEGLGESEGLAEPEGLAEALGGGEQLGDPEAPAWAYAMPEVGPGEHELAPTDEAETWEAAGSGEAGAWEASEVLRYEELAGGEAFDEAALG